MILKNLRHRAKLAWTNLVVAARHDVLLERGVTIKYPASLSFGDRCTIQSGAYLYGSRSGKRVAFGDHVVVAAGAMVLGEGGASIGSFTHLGPHAVLTTQYGDSASPMATPTPRVKTLDVRLGNGCWIGSGAVIMPGAVLGDECVVAPNAVVFGAWGDRVTLSGNPARPVPSAEKRRASTARPAL